MRGLQGEVEREDGGQEGAGDRGSGPAAEDPEESTSLSTSTCLAGVLLRRVEKRLLLLMFRSYYLDEFVSEQLLVICERCSCFSRLSVSS